MHSRSPRFVSSSFLSFQVEYKKVEAEDTSQEKRVKNLEKTCQNLTAKINMEIASREAVEAEMKTVNSEVEAIKRKNKKLEEGIMKAQKDVEGKQEEMRGLVAEITAVQGKNATLMSRMEGEEEEIEVYRGELDAVEESCKEVTATCSKLRSRIAMGNAANSEHRARVAQLKNELAFIRREEGLDESGRQRPILIHSSDSTLVDRLQMNPFLYEAQQQRNPVPMLIEKMAQLLELLHYEQKTADGCLGDLAKSNSLVANMRQLNLDLSGKKNVMASYKSQLVGRVLQNQVEATTTASELVLTGLLLQDHDFQDVLGLVRAYGVIESVNGLHLNKNLLDDSSMTTLLTLLQELPYLKYLDLGENHLSRGALNMLESQLRSMDGVTQTAHTADGCIEVRSGKQIRLKVRIGDQKACRPEPSARLVPTASDRGKGDTPTKGTYREGEAGTPDAESSRLGSGEGEEEVIGGILEELKVDEDDRAVGNKVPIGIGGPGDLSILDRRRSLSSTSSANRRRGGRGRGRVSVGRSSLQKGRRKPSREQLPPPPMVERLPDRRVLDKWQAGTYAKGGTGSFE
ncbi:hypothetical protein Pmar_PMAR028990 [Perkinsus marinus ATCC 50983]|uniref:Uncharacterized protein n=1 Tax=Perkinsus marinus (strain ATCC 50983 / TXsc) TaxID=423536 RepID=C5L674_PERM5|nr:hypothetical protein Pmar_PMAR028990 [Perkinsus marinus ATCC 50983]EER07701.1 hypothetical protein Pmar_PMAR028990 [Perkinsus marinus ATCC 50983]|eukprot:XP_002775885.1 hypothetical protein Pmar_PMAR028990 [Perkinsus marinus ATCC 50983]